jgi:FixJ family two-component response regulator
MTTIRDLPQPLIHVVDDEDTFRNATARLLGAAGYRVNTYRSANDFLLAAPAEPGCVVLDLRMPGLDGLEMQRALNASPNPLPIIFLTGQADVPESVAAMKSGAVDFLRKSVDGNVLLETVARAVIRDAADRELRARQRMLSHRYERLTPRERDVFAHLISGQLNKQIGYDLGITERTTKIHRHNVLEKMDARSVADLVRMAADLKIEPQGQI